MRNCLSAGGLEVVWGVMAGFVYWRFGGYIYTVGGGLVR